MAFIRIASGHPSGIELYQSDASPNGVIAPLGLGALCIVNVAGSVALWQCITLPSTWVNINAGGAGVPLSNVTASLANTSIDNTLFTETWTWSTATAQTLFSLTANALTSGKILAVTSTAVGLTGNLALFQTAATGALATGAVRVSGTGAHTSGSLFQVDTATASGTGLLVTADSLVGGSAFSVTSTAVGLTGTLALFQSASTAAILAGAVRVNMTGAHTGVGLQVDTSTVTGTGLRINANALTSGNALAVISTAAGLTAALAVFSSQTTGALANGGVRVTMGGAHTGPSFQVDTATVTGQAQLLSAPQITIGSLVVGNANAMTTGSLLDLSTSSAAVNSTLGLLRVANSSGTTTGILARFQASSVAGSGMTILGTGAVGLGTTAPVAQLHNAGATILGATTLGDFPGGGNIGTAAATVDVATSFRITQTTVGQTLSLPAPTNTTAGRIAVVYNVGTNSFTMAGVVVTVAATPQTAALQLGWNGAAWVAIL